MLRELEMVASPQETLEMEEMGKRKQRTQYKNLQTLLMMQYETCWCYFFAAISFITEQLNEMVTALGLVHQMIMLILGQLSFLWSGSQQLVMVVLVCQNSNSKQKVFITKVRERMVYFDYLIYFNPLLSKRAYVVEFSMNNNGIRVLQIKCY